MLRWKKILVATDFSPAAHVALRSAERLAREAGGTLIVTHVVEPLSLSYSARRSTLSIDDVETVSEREAHATLDKVVAGSRKRRARVQGVLRVGKPWVEILEVARERGVEAICLGNSGRSMFERLLLGSTAENVVRRSPLPVLVTRHHPLTAVRRIVVPVAFDPGSRQALRVSTEAFPATTDVTAIHVIVPASAFDPMVGILVPDEAATDEELREYLGQKALGRARLQVHVASDLTSVIHDYAQERKADLIVISTHGRRGIARALLGSAAEKIVRYADRPVLVLPGPGRGWSPDAVVSRRAVAARTKRSREGRSQSRAKGRRGHGPWTGQAHTGRGGPAGRRGAGSSAGKRKGGRKARPSKGENR
ncbi:MAG TPA: universal stress protein [Gemmatimonadota bacterium]|nr:universal stress protein [Gemmatimonadota bacterium]